MVFDTSSFTRQLDLIKTMGDFDVAPKYPTIKPNITIPKVQFPGSSGLPGAGTGDFESFIKAIAGQESGGNGYYKVNPDSGALGKYQIMPSNIPSWSKQILGKSISASQFRNSPDLQERIARGMLLRYYQQYGAAGAAAAWYGGPGVAKNWAKLKNPQGAYPSIYNYVMSILKRMRS